MNTDYCMVLITGNSVYGKMITNKERHKNIRYHSDVRKAGLAIASSRFRCLEEIHDDFYEISSEKKSILLDIPVVLGFYILQYAKLRMLEFYYDCIDCFIDRSDFQYCEMDTDSAYMALSKTFRQSIKPSLRRDFWQQHDQWFPRQACSQHLSSFVDHMLADQDWTMLECCKEINNFDKRTPGLFKEEFRGTGIISLNSKTYFCWNEKEEKCRSKGLNRKQNQLTRDQFLSVLKDKSPVSGSNTGFMKKNNHLFTYTQSRNGLTYLYAKRHVLDDGVSTLPLDV